MSKARRYASSNSGQPRIVAPNNANPRCKNHLPAGRTIARNRGRLDACFSGDDFDMICCRTRGVVPDEWAFHRCIDDEMVIVAVARHHLAKRISLILEELDGETWLQIISAQSVACLVNAARRQSTMPDAAQRCSAVASRRLYGCSAGFDWHQAGALGFYWQPKRASNAVQQLADALAAVAQRAEPD